jgi:hypothetical protein
VLFFSLYKYACYFFSGATNEENDYESDRLEFDPVNKNHNSHCPWINGTVVALLKYFNTLWLAVNNRRA